MRRGLTALALLVAIACRQPVAPPPVASSAPVAPPAMGRSDAGPSAGSPAASEMAGASPFVVAIAVDGLRPQHLGRSWALRRGSAVAVLDRAGWRVECVPPESHLAGSPERLWMVAHFDAYSACPIDGDLLRRDRSGWTSVRTLDVHDVLVEPWVDGSTLALYVPFTEGPPWGYALTVLDGGPRAPLVASARGLHDEHGTPCTSRLVEISNLVTFAAGEIMVLAGDECPQASAPYTLFAER
jgi:hypothetical protein